MPSFPPASAYRDLIKLALEEDLGPDGDVTSGLTVPVDLLGVGTLYQKSPGVVCGLPIIGEICRALDPGLRVEGVGGQPIPDVRRRVRLQGDFFSDHPFGVGGQQFVRLDGQGRPRLESRHLVPVIAVLDQVHPHPEIRVGGQPMDVGFSHAGKDVRSAIDAAYRAKYARYGDNYLRPMLAEQAVGATLRVSPQH